MKMLATAAGVVGATWATLYALPMPKPPHTALYDRALVWGIAGVFSLCAVVMVLSRKVWTPRAIGILFTFIGLSMLFWNALYARYVGYHLVTSEQDVGNGRMVIGRYVTNANAGHSEGVSDLARAFLLIGGPLLLTGTIGWLWGRYGPHEDDLIVGEPNRRKTVRREEDRIMRARLAELEAQQ